MSRLRLSLSTAYGLILASLMAACNVSGGGMTPTSPSKGTGATAPTSAPLFADLANPLEVDSTNGVATVNLAAVVNPSTGGPAISYNGTIGIPTIRVSPGDSIVVNFADRLPASTVEPYNETNLHFHGLSVSPNAPSDDSIDILAMPGQTIHYQIDIPKNHPPGTYWYHPHAHGEANWQAYNGMTGAIVIEGVAGIATETAGLPERVMILRNLLESPSFSALARRRSAKNAARSRHDAGGPSGICSQPFGIGGEYTTLDGKNVGGPILMQAGQKQFWRVINASAVGYFDISVDGQNLQLVSRDGVTIKQYPGAMEQTLSDVVIPPAGRADIIVTAPSTSGVAFRTTCFDTGAGGDPNPSQVLGLINVGSPSPALPLVPAPGSTPRATGTYDTPIVGLPIAQQRTVAFTEDDNGFYLNGAAYSPTGTPMFTAQSGTIEEWSLTNYSQEVHDFHIHQVHFVPVDVDGVAQAPMWRDTLNLPVAHADGTPSVTHVLIDFRNPLAKGIFLFHCHLLEHEDGGMMAKIQVI